MVPEEKRDRAAPVRKRLMRKAISILLLLAGIAALWLAGARHPQLVLMRTGDRHDTSETLEDAPPLMVFTTVVLGGFRGLLADILWLRASYLQEEGKYFELVQLSDWITKLEPRHSEIWAFHAWNMAYNASVMMPEPADRWRWVNNGIRLLRDQGLRYNPGDPVLYREIGWIYQNKIGGVTDRDNIYYKIKLATEMTELLGGGRPDYDRLRGDTETLRVMRSEYRLDPGLMLDIESAYGSLDWRLPETHALYWASIGSQRAGEKGWLACDRMIYQAMAASFMQGGLSFRPSEGIYLTAPNIDVLPNVLNAYESAMSKHGQGTIEGAYGRFLRDAVFVLYAFNREKEAMEIFDLLADRFSSAETAEGFEAFVSGRTTSHPIDEVPKRRALALVEGHCVRSFLWLASGDKEQAAALEGVARRLWSRFLENKTPEARERMGLPPFDQIRRLAFQRALDELPEDGRASLLSEEPGMKGL